MLGVLFHQFEKGVFLPALRIEDFDAVPGRFGQHVLQQRAIFEINRRMDEARQIAGFEIQLLEQRRQEFGGVELLEVLPIEIAPIHNSAAAKVKKIHGHLWRLGVPGEYVCIVALRRCDFLALFHFG